MLFTFHPVIAKSILPWCKAIWFGSFPPYKVLTNRSSLVLIIELKNFSVCLTERNFSTAPKSLQSLFWSSAKYNKTYEGITFKNNTDDSVKIRITSAKEYTSLIWEAKYNCWTSVLNVLKTLELFQPSNTTIQRKISEWSECQIFQNLRILVGSYRQIGNGKKRVYSVLSMWWKC